MKSLRAFNTQAQYNEVKCDLEETVAMVRENDSVNINEENYFIATYNVTTTSSGTKIFGSSFNPYTLIHKMYVDGVEVKLTNNDVYYTFATTGEHSVKCVFCDITNVYGLFSYCKNLIKVDLSSFNTSKITDMGWMFSECENLKSINLSNFDTSKVTNMTGMFARCSGLTSLDLSSFNTSNVTNMGSMFNSCKSLTSLNLNKFDLLKVKEVNEMFSQCSKLNYIDLSKNGLTNVTNYVMMFMDVPENGKLIINCNYQDSWDGICSASTSYFPTSWTIECK